MRRRASFSVGSFQFLCVEAQRQRTNDNHFKNLVLFSQCFTEAEDFLLVEPGELFTPILDGLAYSIFELPTPFVFWSDFSYEGPKLFSGSRVAQTFLMYPPAGYLADDFELGAVRIALDISQVLVM